MEALTKSTKWEAADKAFNKGVEAYIEFGQECARLNSNGTTQQEIGNRYGMSQQQVGYAVIVGSDKRITTTGCNHLPKSTRALYLLTTLDDQGFELLAKPDTTQADIKAYKEAQQPPKPRAIPSPKPVPEPEPEEPEMKKGGYVTIAQKHGLISAATGSRERAKIRERIEQLAPGAIEEQNAVRIEDACRIIVVERNPEKARQEADAMKKELPESWQKKFDKALSARITVEIADMQKQFDEQLRDAKEQLAIKLQEAEAEREAAFQYRLGIDSHMTMDEFKLVRSCLHPDRAPEDRRERFDKAFTIFNRLEKTVNTKAPISILRRHGWEKASPFHKAA